MTPDAPYLETLYGELANHLSGLAIDGDTEAFTLTAGNLPRPPATARSNEFWVRRSGFHFYDNFPVDSVSLCIDKRSSTTLGLFLLAAVFHAQPEVLDVELGHPASTVRHIRVHSQHDSPEYGDGLGLIPAFFSYSPRAVPKHPWLDELPADPWHLPHFQITNANEVGPVRGLSNNFDDDMARRDTLLMDSSIQGHVRLAELLLNAGLSDNLQSEFALEAEGGFRGVAPLSAEVTFWLPGSLGYDPRDRG